MDQLLFRSSVNATLFLVLWVIFVLLLFIITHCVIDYIPLLFVLFKCNSICESRKNIIIIALFILSGWLLLQDFRQWHSVWEASSLGKGRNVLFTNTKNISSINFFQFCPFEFKIAFSPMKSQFWNFLFLQLENKMKWPVFVITPYLINFFEWSTCMTSCFIIV